MGTLVPPLTGSVGGLGRRPVAHSALCLAHSRSSKILSTMVMVIRPFRLQAIFNTFNLAYDLNSLVRLVWEKGVFLSEFQNYIN